MRHIYKAMMLLGLLVLGAETAQAQGWGSWSYPSYPVYVTPTQVTGFNVFGGMNTAGTTIHNSAFDPYRNISMHNGTMHTVNRPIYDSWGRVVGYKSGQQWFNNYTGQYHFQGQVYRPNGMGGVNVQNVARYQGN